MSDALRLLDTELRRFFARRAIRWLLGLGLLVALIVNVAQLARSSEQTVLVHQPFRIEPRNGTVVVPGTLPATPPLFRETRDRRVRVGHTFEETVRGTGVALVLLAVLLAATFLAAEFGANGLSTQLLFEPRRWWVYLAKTAAAALGSAAIAVALLAWTGLGQYLASALRGSTAGVDGGWLVSRTGDVLRVGLAVALAAVVSLAITAMARRTTVAVAVFFGQMIAVGFLGNTSWGKGIARISPINALWATAFGRVRAGDFAGLDSLAAAVTIAVVWAAIGIAVGGAWLASREIR